MSSFKAFISSSLNAVEIHLFELTGTTSHPDMQKIRMNGFFYSKPNQMHNISNLFYFGNNTLHVSDGLFVHHQESKSLHTASGICHTGSVAAY